MLLSLDRSPQTGEFSPSLRYHFNPTDSSPLLPSRHECLGARDLDSPSFYPRSGPAGEGIEDEGLRSSDTQVMQLVGLVPFLLSLMLNRRGPDGSQRERDR